MLNRCLGCYVRIGGSEERRELVLHAEKAVEGMRGSPGLTEEREPTHLGGDGKAQLIVFFKISFF